MVKIGPVDPKIIVLKFKQKSLALASMARDDPPASSTANSTAAAMRGKVGSEFETKISYNKPKTRYARFWLEQ